MIGLMVNFLGVFVCGIWCKIEISIVDVVGNEEKVWFMLVGFVW